MVELFIKCTHELITSSSTRATPPNPNQYNHNIISGPPQSVPITILYQTHRILVRQPTVFHESQAGTCGALTAAHHRLFRLVLGLAMQAAAAGVADDFPTATPEEIVQQHAELLQLLLDLCRRQANSHSKLESRTRNPHIIWTAGGDIATRTSRADDPRCGARSPQPLQAHR